jgi:hypothetical protein
MSHLQVADLVPGLKVEQAAVVERTLHVTVKDKHDRHDEIGADVVTEGKDAAH